MVVGWATDIVVVLGQGRLGLLGEGLPVEAVAEDGFETFVTVAAQGEGALAGGLKPVIAVGFSQGAGRLSSCGRPAGGVCGQTGHGG